eukprot:Tamp_23403.p2 GENE.Tamp_23403~~Tamp_23403.p2  ORF type:complete len:229 (+),score=21.75 Tamp_23403:138-824(+)
MAQPVGDQHAQRQPRLQRLPQQQHAVPDRRRGDRTGSEGRTRAGPGGVCHLQGHAVLRPLDAGRHHFQRRVCQVRRAGARGREANNGGCAPHRADPRGGNTVGAVWMRRSGDEEGSANANRNAASRRASTVRLDRERPQLTTAEARALYPPEDCLLDRNMTMPQLEECGSGEHGKGKKKHRCSDLRRRIDVWTSSDAAELGAMYPCCKRCNQMANEREREREREREIY